MARLPRPRPREGIADFFAFVREQRQHQLWIILASLALPLLLVYLVVTQFAAKEEYREPEVTYVTQWSANRTEADVKAQQAKDLPAEQAALDARKAAEAKERESYRRIAKVMGIPLDK